MTPHIDPADGTERSATPPEKRTARRMGVPRAPGAPRTFQPQDPPMQQRFACRRGGYTLAEVIGAVVIGAVILAMAAPAIAHAVRVRAAEATLKNDLHNAASAMEAAYLAAGAYPELPVLQTRGLPLSPRVAVDSQAVHGERVYLRLRHVPTGQLCALDYSRSSPVARNRADCYGGGQARDTALTLTAERPPAEPSDTFRIEPPVPPDPVDSVALANPDLEQPADQTALPGESLRQVVMVTNRSPLLRRFRLETGSSDPALIAAPSVEPDLLTLLPDVPSPVELSYTLNPSALAGASAVIALRAVDDGDERFARTVAFSASTGLALASPAVAATGAEYRVERPGDVFEVAWRVTNRSNAARTLTLSLAPGALELLEATGAGRLPFAAGETRTVSARARIPAGTEAGIRGTVSLEAADAEAPAHRAEARVEVEAAVVLAAPTLTAPAQHAADPGSTFTLTWQLRNESNAARSFHIRPSVSDADHLQIVGSAGTGPRPVGPGGTASVTVTYRMRSGSLAGHRTEAVLQASDHDAPEYNASAATRVETNLLVAPPALTAPPPHSAGPDAEFTVRWTVRNETNAPRVLVVGAPAPPGAELSLVSTTGTGEVPFAPLETRTVAATYRVASAAVADARCTPTLTVGDLLVSSAAASAAFEFTTAAEYRAPALTAPADRAMDPGSSAAVVFRVVNRSNAARTFALLGSSTNPAAVANPNALQPLTLPPFGAADVTIRLDAPPGAVGRSEAVVRLGATDAERPALVAAAEMRVSINPRYLPPDLTFGEGRTVVPGTAARDTATLVNRSNMEVEFCFRAGAVAGSVDAGKVVATSVDAPSCLTLGPAGTSADRAPVEVRYSAARGALAGWTNAVTLRAEQRSPEPMASSAELPVTAALALRAPSWVSLPASPQSWEVGEIRTLEHEFRNESNGVRRFCVEISSADPARLAPLSTSPVCDLPVLPGERRSVSHVFRAEAPSTGPVVVEARVWDQDAAEQRGSGSYQSVIRATRPVARWTAPSPAYVRKWLSFDASPSASPVGAEIVRYVWTWGLFWQRWDEPSGRFVWGDEQTTARDDVTVPLVRRAFDFEVPHEVCLTVVDAAGRASEPNCQTVELVKKTQARLAWRYRGWWRGNNCIDVPWDSQCAEEHGTARWELDLGPSMGGVRVQRAQASIRVALHNTDDPDRPWAGTFTGNAGKVPAWSSYGFDLDWPAASGSAQDGRWRVLDTDGTASYAWPRPLEQHPLVQNVNLGAATGIYDTGPHWVPDDVWITLHVQDAYGEWTSMSGHQDHPRSDWRSRITKPYAEQGPDASIAVEEVRAGSFRLSGSGASREGRIVGSGWSLTVRDFSGESYSYPLSGETIDVGLAMCESASVYFTVTDELGRSGSAMRSLSGEMPRECLEQGQAEQGE